MERAAVRRRLNPNTQIAVEIPQTLPPELQHQILKEVCEDGFADFWRAKSTCKALREVSDTPAFHRDVDLYVMQALDFPHDGVIRFKNRCLHHESPSAFFVKGTSDFFKDGRLQEGLEGIRWSAVAGYELGCYAYAMIHRILNPQVMILNGMGLVTKEFVRRMRREVELLPDIAWPMFDTRPALYDDMVNHIPTDDVYNCRCRQNRRFVRAWFEECKIGPMCDACFWICQMEWFSRKFPKKCLIGLTNTIVLICGSKCDKVSLVRNPFCGILCR